MKIRNMLPIYGHAFMDLYGEWGSESLQIQVESGRKKEK